MMLGKNLGLITVRKMPLNSSFGYFMATDCIISNGAIRSDNQSIDSLFPLYIYPSKKNNTLANETIANFSPKFLAALKKRLKLKFIVEGNGDFETTISALDVFNYMYAVFHSPTYRTRYAEFLKMDFHKKF